MWSIEEGNKNWHLGPRTRPAKLHVFVKGNVAWVKASLSAHVIILRHSCCFQIFFSFFQPPYQCHYVNCSFPFSLPFLYIYVWHAVLLCMEFLCWAILGQMTCIGLCWFALLCIKWSALGFTWASLGLRWFSKSLIKETSYGPSGMRTTIFFSFIHLFRTYTYRCFL